MSSIMIPSPLPSPTQDSEKLKKAFQGLSLSFSQSLCFYFYFYCVFILDGRMGNGWETNHTHTGPSWGESTDENLPSISATLQWITHWPSQIRALWRFWGKKNLYSAHELCLLNHIVCFVWATKLMANGFHQKALVRTVGSFIRGEPRWWKWGSKEHFWSFGRSKHYTALNSYLFTLPSIPTYGAHLVIIIGFKGIARPHNWITGKYYYLWGPLKQLSIGSQVNITKWLPRHLPNMLNLIRVNYDYQMASW